MLPQHGRHYGTNGFVLIPFDYILNPKYTGELYTIDFKKERVEGYINQRKEMVNLQNNREVQRENKNNIKKILSETYLDKKFDSKIY